ncbi:MAG TPA: hypothetical protein VEL76_04820 [Gemmataceae bacterium]|nr:hypothetical protein [Gemmataceae bacterium]
MNGTLIATVIAAVLALPAGLTLPVVAGEPSAALATTPNVPLDVSGCTSSDGMLLAQGGCCLRQGGVCGCSNGVRKCCNGTTASGQGCACRGSIEEGAFETLLPKTSRADPYQGGRHYERFQRW